MRIFGQDANSALEPMGVSEPDGRLAFPHLLLIQMQLCIHTARFKDSFDIPQSQWS